MYLQPADSVACTDYNNDSSEDPGCHWNSEAGGPVVEIPLAKRKWVKASIALH